MQAVNHIQPLLHFEEAFRVGLGALGHPLELGGEVVEFQCQALKTLVQDGDGGVVFAHLADAAQQVVELPSERLFAVAEVVEGRR